MAANTSTIIPKSGDEFNSEISELNQCIEKLDRMIKELLKRGGDRTEEEAEKLNDAIEFFNGKQEEVKNKLREFEVLGAFANGTRTLQISDMNSFFEELDGKVTEYLLGETRLVEEIKKKCEMQRGGGGGESSSTNVPDDDDPGYSQNIQSKRELNILKETMKTCTEIVEIILRSMNQDLASLLPNQNVAKWKLEESHIGESGKELDLKVNEAVNQSKNCDSISTEADLEISGGNVGAEVSKESGVGGESSGLTSKDETNNIELGFDLGDDTKSSEELQSDSAGNVVIEEEEEEAGEVENEGDDTSSSEDANDTIESSLYTNIQQCEQLFNSNRKLAEEMNELMRKLEEGDA